jgi:hypothetical protein
MEFVCCRRKKERKEGELNRRAFRRQRWRGSVDGRAASKLKLKKAAAKMVKGCD